MTKPPTRKAELTARRRALQFATKAEALRLAEIQAEAISPAAQRLDTRDEAGNVTRHARVMRDGITFVRSNPIKHLIARGSSTIRPRHEVAADRLVVAWEEGGRSVGMASKPLGEGAGAATSHGALSEHLRACMAYQHRQKAVFDGARIWLGMLWPAIEAVVLHGIDVSAYAAKILARREVALGYLCAALDRLCEFFTAIDKTPAKGIRAVTVVKTVDKEAAS